MNVSSRSPTRTNENWMSNTRDYMKPFGSSDSMMQSIDMDIRKTTGKIEKDRATSKDGIAKSIDNIMSSFKSQTNLNAGNDNFSKTFTKSKLGDSMRFTG